MAIDQRGERLLLECRDDQQDDVGAVSASLVNLVRPHDEVLAEHRNGDRFTDCVEVGQRAVKTALFGENTDDACATGLVSRGKLCGIGNVGQRTL